MAENGSKKIEEVSLVERLVTLIRDAILIGELEPGAHIRIKRIADEYGVSMIPVREALARLLASRLVRAEPNRGYFVVAKPTPAEFRQFVQARELFERSVVALGFDNATEADARKLRGLNDRMRKVAMSGRKNKIVEWSRLNTEFHQVLVGLARNSYLSDMYSDLAFGNMHIQLVRRYPAEFTNLLLLVEEHDEMIAALEDNDKDRLLSVLSDHIYNLTLDD
ncbi:MAG: GntR family transcriptional regulator [Roseovarius sp.]|nr:GntR family transcriptional regulator [Roseovarius sp.]